MGPASIADLHATALALNAELEALGGTPPPGIGQTIKTLPAHIETAALAVLVRKAREARAAKQGTVPPTDLARLAEEIRTRLTVAPAAAPAPTATPSAEREPSEREILLAQSQLCTRSRTLGKALAAERRRKRQ